MKTLELAVVVKEEYLVIKVCPEERFQWNEWHGFIPSDTLRGAMLKACEIIITRDVELLLADFTKLCAPTLDDQVWIASHTAAILSNSKLKRVANILAKDIFQQLAIESIYEKASAVPLPCVSKDFISREEAMEWLFDRSDISL